MHIVSLAIINLACLIITFDLIDNNMHFEHFINKYLISIQYLFNMLDNSTIGLVSTFCVMTV